MSVTIRPATEADQATLTRLIRQARLNPRHLHWANFLIAEVDGQIVGLRQVKTHAQGTREVASGLVLPEYRRQGISARLMREILAREQGPLYLMCDRQWAAYYKQFGFEPVAPNELPADFGREYRLGRLVTIALSLFARREIRIMPLKRNG
jgi:N-acetylglutamate synthase-like GNAT family acetyltransferase